MATSVRSGLPLQVRCKPDFLFSSPPGGRFCSFSPCIEQSQRCIQELTKLYKLLAQQNHYPQIEAELSKLPAGKEWLRPDVKITYTPIEGDSSSDEDMDDDDEEDDDEMGQDEEDAPSSSGRMTRSQTRKQQAQEFVEPEDGWTTVRRK